MNEQILSNLLQDIQNENVRFGSCEVRFTFHDGRPVNYELTIHRRRNIASSSADNHERANIYGRER